MTEKTHYNHMKNIIYINDLSQLERKSLKRKLITHGTPEEMSILIGNEK